MQINKNPDIIKSLFNSISTRYDFLNHLFSFGMDLRWRRKTAEIVKQFSPRSILDLCCGTCDLAISISSKVPDNCRIYAVDFSENMLKIAKRKIFKKNLQNKISLIQADGLKLPFKDSSFDVCTIGFGLRNLSSPEQGLRELIRITKDSGKIVILEFDVPQNKIMRFIYLKYFLYVMPFLASLFLKKSQDFPDNPFKYLSASVMDFPDHNKIIPFFEKNGLANVKTIINTFGISVIYIGDVKKC